MVWTNEGAFIQKIVIGRKCFISFYRCVCVGGGSSTYYGFRYVVECLP